MRGGVWVGTKYVIGLTRGVGGSQSRWSTLEGMVEEDEQTVCFVCHKIYEERTEKGETWIMCDSCECWCHTGCVNIDEQSISDKFVCRFC